MTRKLFLDTETTGLHPAEGHRVVEICLLETIDDVLTGNKFHTYLNPERESDKEAFLVHNLSSEFLADKPKFADVALAMLAFIRDSVIVGQYVKFDIGFLNAELARVGEPNLVNVTMCTKQMFKRVFGSSHKAKLDIICDYYMIDRSHRAVHTAEVDANLCYQVYLKLIKERVPMKYQPATLDEVNDFIRASETAEFCATPISLWETTLADRLIARMNQTYKQQVANSPTTRIQQADGTVQVGSTRYANFKVVLQKELNEADEIIGSLKAFEELALRSDVSAKEVRDLELDCLTDIGDHLTDIIVYCMSEATKFGIPTMDIIRLVQASNQSKLDSNGQPIIDENGKFLKGPNFQAPERFIKAWLKSADAENDTPSDDDTFSDDNDFVD